MAQAYSGPRVFVCHSPADAEYGRQFAAQLQAGGADVWLDQNYGGFAGGQRRVVEHELATRQHFIIILSPAALASDWINAQIDAALELVKDGQMLSFIPVIAAPCAIPLLISRFPTLGKATAPLPPDEAAQRALALLRAPGAGKQFNQPSIAPSVRLVKGFFRVRTLLFIMVPVLVVALIVVGVTRLFAEFGKPFGSSYHLSPFDGIDLHGVAFAAPNDGWAVGSGGAILHYDGSKWTQTAHAPTNVELDAVAVTPGGADAWAVGREGTIIHEQQGQWTQAHSPTDKQLLGVTMISSAEGWAVGVNRTILHYHQGAWQVFPAPFSDQRDFLSVAMLSPTDGWIAGRWDTLLHFDGQRWQPVEKGDDLLLDIYQVAMLAPHDGWLVAQDGGASAAAHTARLAHYDGRDWTIKQTVPGADLFAISMLSSADGWALGLDFSSGSVERLVVYHDVNGVWSQAKEFDQDTSLSLAGLHAFVMLSDTEGWAVGGTGTILHCHNGQWNLY